MALRTLAAIGSRRCPDGAGAPIVPIPRLLLVFQSINGASTIHDVQLAVGVLPERADISKVSQLPVSMLADGAVALEAEAADLTTAEVRVEEIGRAHV